MMRNNSWGSAGRGNMAVADAQWDAVGDDSNGSSSANGSGSGNGSANAEGESEMPMTPEPDHGRESARAARARARAAVAERHKAELKDFAGLDQQMEQALNSPSTPAVIAELHQLRQECDRVELQWHQGAADGEMMTAAAEEMISAA